MKVFLTGATGCVGAHTALHLLKKGHAVRLLVRNAAAAKAYFRHHGYDVTDIVEADMRDREKVRAAMIGCDAVFHAAAMVSLDPKKAAEIYQSNLDSVESVLGSAVQLGIKNSVYVSSLSAFFDPRLSVINEQTTLGNPREAYSLSKRDCERYVRNLQAQGAPIQITYPSGIFGPHDPKLNESNHSLISLVRIVPITSSGIQCVDVRDLADVHVFLLENPPTGDVENARYIVAGRFYPWPEFHALMERVTGRKIWHPHLPGGLLRAMGALMDIVKKIYPVDIPVTSESMAIITQWPIADSSRIQQKMGLEFRDGEETFADTINWMRQAGYIADKFIAKLAS
ncbi:MAG TPA: NAD-dependent epimerase/dehydratase family protein [Pseudomonadales bacterium]|nr:NAD-dependent epimerase/dehydratase family protein [Pseudomonadales bacterium]